MRWKVKEKLPIGVWRRRFAWVPTYIEKGSLIIWLEFYEARCFYREENWAGTFEKWEYRAIDKKIDDNDSLDM